MDTVTRSVVAPSAVCAQRSIHATKSNYQASNLHFRRRPLLRQQRLSPRAASKASPSACKGLEAHANIVKGETVALQIVGSSVLATLVLCTLLWPAEPAAAAQHFHPDVYQIATGDSDFWVNVSRYGRYFITVLLGTAYISVKPILQLLKRPKTAVAVILGLAALYLFVSTTVQAMLGVSNPLEYQPSGFFPDNY